MATRWRGVGSLVGLLLSVLQPCCGAAAHPNGGAGSSRWSHPSAPTEPSRGEGVGKRSASVVPLVNVPASEVLAFSWAAAKKGTPGTADSKSHYRGRRASTDGERRLCGWHSGPSVGKGAAVGGVGTGLPLAFLLEKAHASPFDPHPLPFLLGTAFFNGWCVRVTDHEKGLSFAVIVGSFKHKHADAYTEHYVALVYSDKDGNRVTAHAFPDPEGVTITSNNDGVTGVPSNFTWKSPDVGELRIEENKGRFDFRLPGFSAVGTIHDRVPWDPARPDAAGPEGWLGRTPLLPCRYFVHSLASKTSYALRIRGREERHGPDSPQDVRDAARSWGAEMHGRGYAHLESNYGKHFPSGWIWAQAVSQLRDVKLIMVGGKFQIGPAAPTTWTIGYRSPRFSWNFRTTDLDTVAAQVDYTKKGVTLTATSNCGRKRLEVEITAPEGSFGSPIYVPTPEGFSSEPGCRDSFMSRAKIRAVDLSTDRMRIVEEHDIELAALEFGGNMQRL